jgi:SAM-dependent methyltransferase
VHPDKVREGWAERSGEYSPDYYAYYGPNETSEWIRERLDAALGPDAAVVELGCSSGRHLAHLHEHGYENLHGVEINDDAFDVMAEEYPGLADAGTFYAESIENAVADFEDDRFDAVFSVETLQHIHPDHEWVFGDLTRITDDLLLTAEIEADERQGTGQEGAEDNTEESDERRDSDEQAVNYVDDGVPLYYRDWGRVFTERGFVEITAESAERDTLRAFRPVGE